MKKLIIVAGAACLLASASLVIAGTYGYGDVFVSTGIGHVQWRHNNGALVATLDGRTQH